ncbi:MAG: membrane protein insertase YidC [Verrucomicrobiota bacterium]|nr:membrane protein insertase YidC [Verrucomicrobiota bacterium]
MNRQEAIVVGLLFLGLMGWIFTQQQQAAAQRRMDQERFRHEQRVRSEQARRTVGTDTGAVERAMLEPVAASDAVPQLAAECPGPAPAAARRRHEAREQTLTLTNGEAEVALSSWGGGIASVTLNKYRQRIEQDSEPVRFDFARQAALVFAGIPGLSTNDDFTLSGGGVTATVKRVTDAGLRFTRTVSLEPGYRVSVVDIFFNTGSEAAKLPAHTVALGPMEMTQTRVRGDRGQYLEVDTQPVQSGRRAETWDSSHFSERFGIRSSRFSCGRPSVAGAPFEIASPAADTALDWAAVKNKFFAQILAPEGGSAGYQLRAERRRDAPDFALSSVSAELLFAQRDLPPGGELRRGMSYYVGPKKYDLLKNLGQHQDRVMLKAWAGWGWYRTLCVWVLWTLNKLHGVFHSYGVAIILVTVIARILFWPVTHMGAKSMKRMQDLQPLMAEIRAQHKENPRKMHEQTMLLYRKHKINPAAGCLPMLVQMPAFIALFNVLRSAVELRFASFLWIPDLSEPEGLLQGMIPAILGGELNILPLLMTATSFLQNRLTPSTADPQQKMMMNVMPVMMLVFFYKMASGLVVYWTVSQLLAIAQLTWQRRRGGTKKTPAGEKKDS